MPVLLFVVLAVAKTCFMVGIPFSVRSFGSTREDGVLSYIIFS